MKSLLPVSCCLFVAVSCSTTVNVKTTPENNGVIIVHQGQQKGVGQASFEVGSSVFYDNTIQFLKDGKTLLTTRLERSISVPLLLLGFVTVYIAWLWVAPIRENQLFDLSPFLKDKGGYTQTVVSGFTDRVLLRTGQSYDGVKAAVTADSVIVTTQDGRTLVFPKSGVQSVQKGNSP